MLSIRSSVKEDLKCSPAELLYGQTLRLPQEFVSHRQVGVHQSEFVSKLKDHFRTIEPTPTRARPENSFVNIDLYSCRRVLIRKDHSKQPLELRYSGPYEVLERRAKFFHILVDNKIKTVSVDRLKRFHDGDDTPFHATKFGRVVLPPIRYTA